MVAERAGISLRTLRNIESGNGSSLNTLIRVLRVLGRKLVGNHRPSLQSVLSSWHFHFIGHFT
ncbi:helix-turn-helix domain-containing protein [Iodobacter fluviatilis]|uniref:helix-turn-helix domain-containing protein n=1 Tax=Iodobacter fluviatilis TaxID=537 RepID=UPI000E1C38AA